MFENKTALIKKMVRAFYPFAKQYIGFTKPVRLFMRHDPQNAVDPLGKTAYYDPDNWTITVYTVDRHPKDIVRSIAHELVHHKQNCEGRLTNINTNNITEDSHLKQLEEEAYRDGNSCFRSWEDQYKATVENLMENKMNEKNEGEYSGDITENDTVKEYYVKRADKVANHVANRFGFKFDFNLNNDQEGGEQK